MPLPTKKSLPVFLYTKDVVNIDVVPESTSTSYGVGELIAFDSAITGTGGYFQGTEINVIKGKKHDPTYTDAASLNFLGVMAEKYPPNFFLYQDVDQELTVEDYSSAVAAGGSFAGDLERMTVCVMPNIILVDFWDAANNQAESLVASDIFATVYASQTAGSDTGKAGKASLERSNDDGATSKVAIGRLLGIPVSGGNYGYVLIDPLGAR